MLMSYLLKKEIRTRMRTRTIFRLSNAYLVSLMLITCGIFVFEYLSANNQGWSVGRLVFGIINGLQILILMIISPSITASTITMEKEQKTYDILMATPLTLREIVLSKLVASLSYFFILTLIGLPGMSICFILGGISLQEVLLVYIVTILSITLVGAMGIYISCVYQRTIVSVPVSGVLVVSFLILTWLSYYIFPGISSINPLVVLYLLLNNLPIKCFNLELPFWIPYIVMTGLVLTWLLTRSIEMLKIEEKRNLSISQIFLLLIMVAVFIFAFGSIDFNVPYQIIQKRLLLYPYFLVFIATAGIVCISTGRAGKTLEGSERGFLQQSLSNWFGGGIIAASRFLPLMIMCGLIVFGLGMSGIPLVKDKLSIFVLISGIILGFTIGMGLSGRFLSINKYTKGIFIPRIINSIILSMVLFLPLILSSHAHNKDAYIQTPLDLLLFFNPIKAIEVTINPGETLRTIPFCKDILGDIPFAVITVLIYLIISGSLLGCIAFTNSLARASNREISLVNFREEGN